MHERYGIAAHRVAADGREAAALALKAGVNIELPWADCYRHIPELVEEGIIPEETIDRLVGEMLRAKFRLGLFDEPYVDPAVAEEVSGSGDHAALALETALKSVALLENRDHTVPLDAGALRRIAVIGPNAHRVILGGYSGNPPYFISVLDGIRERVGDTVEVVYAQGCRITVGGSWVEDRVTLPDPEEERALIRQAVELAETCDLVVLAVGGNEQTSREAWNIYHLGDRSEYPAHDFFYLFWIELLTHGRISGQVGEQNSNMFSLAFGLGFLLFFGKLPQFLAAFIAKLCDHRQFFATLRAV